MNRTRQSEIKQAQREMRPDSKLVHVVRYRKPIGLVGDDDNYQTFVQEYRINMSSTTYELSIRRSDYLTFMTKEHSNPQEQLAISIAYAMLVGKGNIQEYPPHEDEDGETIYPRRTIYNLPGFLQLHGRFPTDEEIMNFQVFYRYRTFMERSLKTLLGERLEIDEWVDKSYRIVEQVGWSFNGLQLVSAKDSPDDSVLKMQKP